MFDEKSKKISCESRLLGVCIEPFSSLYSPVSNYFKSKYFKLKVWVATTLEFSSNLFIFICTSIGALKSRHEEAIQIYQLPIVQYTEMDLLKTGVSLQPYFFNYQQLT